MAVAALVAISACGSDKVDDGKLYTVVFGGDTILARHTGALMLDKGVEAPLDGIKEITSSADLAILNLECVIASGGRITRKGWAGLVHYRARPEAVGSLVHAGVDVVTLANNHAMDYGIEALLENNRILEQAGIAYVGAGKDREQAMAPVFRKLGDTVVAVISLHTNQSRSRAGKSSPGTNQLTTRNADRLVERIARQVELAREHAHIVLLAIHWGGLEGVAPSDQQRELARRFVADAEIDGLLGSGQHEISGVEVIDGRPIIYDAGNFLFDTTFERFSKYPRGRSAVFRLHLNRGGVRKVEAIPVTMDRCQVALAEGSARQKVIADFVSRSEKLGTAVKAHEDRVVIDIVERYEPDAPREPYVPPKIETAASVPEPNSYPPTVVVDQLPADATPRSAKFANGIELLGFDIDESARLGHGIFVKTYWRATRPLDQSYQFFYDVTAEANGEGEWKSVHQPAGGVYPTTWWKPGQIVEDVAVARPPWPPKRERTGRHELSVGILHGKKRIAVVISTEGGDSATVRLGSFEITE